MPARYSFWDLQVAIQDAMGWWYYHLHEFRPRDRERRKQVLIGMPSEEDFADAREVLPGWEIPVTAYLCEPGDRVEYEYDFGDSWRHEITLHSIAPRVKGQRGIHDASRARGRAHRKTVAGCQAISLCSKHCLTRNIQSTKP